MKKFSVLAIAACLMTACAMVQTFGQEKAADSGPITGLWKCMSHGGPEGDTNFTLDLQQDGEKVTGAVDSDMGGMDITSGTFKDDTLEIRLETPQGNYVLKATLKEGQLSGKVTLDEKDQGTWQGKKAPPSDNK